MKYAITFLFSLSLMISKKDCSRSTVPSTTVHQTKNNDFDLGTFSLSLSVKDIKASFEFYKKMGFEHLEGAGGMDQNWMILKNEKIKIGLFQGMFPQNTLTFNPKDGRKIYSKLKDSGVTFSMATGMDKSEGPCTFMMIDPDGNPILVDQH